MLSEIGRRAFLKGALASAAATSACTSQRPGARRPNILFCIADDQSYPHAGALGSSFVRTPGFDRVAKEGVVFRNTFVSVPSCCPSRGSVLTGQDFYRLKEASMNHTVWPGGIPLYPDLLAEAGYHTGFTGKGWSPGNWKVSGRPYNPAGPGYNSVTLKPPAGGISNTDYAGNLEAFLAKRPAGAPFCFWVGFNEPHRIYESGAGEKHGIKLSDMQVPGFLPDSPEVRGDIADYVYEIEWYDSQLARILELLDKRGELNDTIVVVTADNGMPFPRAKGNLYDYGTRMPTAIRWGDRVKPGRVIDDFVSFTDFAPTFLEASGVGIPAAVTGRSLMPLLTAAGSGQIDPARSHAVFGIERHFPGGRPNGAGYPSRAIRSENYLYIRNLMPGNSPASDHPGPVWPSDDPVGGYGDTDGGPAKTYLYTHRNEHAELFRLAFGKRPAEELYHVTDDPYNMKNLAGDPAHAAAKKEHAELLDKHLLRTQDPRATGRGQELDDVMRRFPKL